jgi:transcriptional regulator with XRE-family HTH domain
MDLIPGRLRELRLSRLLTQVELSELAGTTQSTINRIELGIQRPRISTVRKLAEALGVPASALVVGPKEAREPNPEDGGSGSDWTSTWE